MGRVGTESYFLKLGESGEGQDNTGKGGKIRRSWRKQPREKLWHNLTDLKSLGVSIIREIYTGRKRVRSRKYNGCLWRNYFIA